MARAATADMAEYKRQWRAANLDSGRAASKRWREANREKANENSARWRAENPERYAEWRQEYVKEWNDANRDSIRESKRRSKAKNPERHAAQQLAWRDRNRDAINAQHARLYAENAEVRLRALVNGAKSRAKKCGVSFDLSHREIVWPVVCPVLGIPINYGLKGRREYGSPSLDRVDPKGGYTKDNVRVISWRANFLKTNATISEMEMVVKFMEGL